MDQIKKNEIIAVVLFALSFFLFLSLFTFSEQDLSFYTSSPNLIAQNATGVVGSYIGGVLLFIIGKASYVIPLLILVWGLSRLFQLEENKISFKVFGTVVLVSAVSSSLSMAFDSTRAAAFNNGGLIGAITSNFLIEYLGRVGATVFIVALILLSLLIATEFLLLPVLLRTFSFLSSIPVTVRSKINSRKESYGTKANPLRDKMNTTREELSRKLQAVKRQVEESRKTVFADENKGREYEEPVVDKPAKTSKLRKARKVVKKPVTIAPTVDQEEGDEYEESMEYNMPTVDLFNSLPEGSVSVKDEDLKKNASILENTLLEFGVEAKVVKINKGPVITMYELEPALGTKVNRITSLSDNISLAMRSANIRILAPIPGKGTVGIEVPNPKSELVLLRDLLESEAYEEEEAALKMALGKDVSGFPIVSDLSKMPHLLIAGATGSGKTVCINCIISSFLYNSSPDEVKLLMIDPKRVELMMYEGIPHLVSPIVTNPKKAASALGWVIHEMERRYEIFADKGVRNILSYKDRQEEDDENLPFIVVVVDELADLMMVAQQDVEGAIMRIAQLSRAAGIHLILATQRPSVNVITGVIKANFPARISFKVASKVDSRTVLDANGAEKLLGRGDMLFMEPGETSLIRGQCSLVDDKEIKGLVKFIKDQAGPRYINSAVEKQEKKNSGAEQEKDDLYNSAVELVLQTKQASVSMIQRKFRVGYTRAARIIDFMEEDGIVGPYNGSKPRDILIESIEELTEEEQ